MGIISSALTGFAQGAATGYVQGIEAEIEALKQETILEKREAMRVKGRQSDADQDIANLPKLSAAKRAESNLDADNTIATKERLAPRTRALASDDAVAANQSAADITIANAGNKGLMSAQRTIKQNEHIESKGQELQNQLTQAQIDKAVRVSALQEKYLAAAPKDRPAINEEIQLLTGRDSDNIKPITHKDGETGNVSVIGFYNTKSMQKYDADGEPLAKSGTNDPKSKADALFGPPKAKPDAAPAAKPSQEKPQAKPPVSEGDFYKLKNMASSLDAELKRVTNKMNDAQSRNNAGEKAAAINELQELGRERAEVEAKMNAIRQRDAKRGS